MSSFTSELRVSPDPIDPTIWVLDKSFTYWLADKGKGWKITVPKGFRTNFASSPRILWPLFPPWGKHGKAAVVHDYLYGNHLVTKRVADAIFWEAMGVLKVNRFKKWLMFKAVVWFGRKAWNSGA